MSNYVKADLEALEGPMPRLNQCYMSIARHDDETIEYCAEKGIPFPKLWVVSGFPEPSIPEKDRPWNKNVPMKDPEFKEECRKWNVNEIIFEGSNWQASSREMGASEIGRDGHERP